jgi:predicted metal-dependent HD superfamily phosphohydrolase
MNLFAQLERSYSEPHRFYHTKKHIDDCLSKLSLWELSFEERAILTDAILWHDAVYNPRSSTNEADSAKLYARSLLNADPFSVQVHRLINLTAKHNPVEGDRLGQILVSIDLSILGSSLEAYELYAENIRKEYSFVSDEDYAIGRSKVLEGFLAKEVIFPDALAFRKWEAAARSNIEGELLLF